MHAASWISWNRGVDFEDVTEQLEREGLAKFEKSWNELSHTIAAELHRNHPARNPDPGPATDRMPSSASRANEGRGDGNFSYSPLSRV